MDVLQRVRHRRECDLRIGFIKNNKNVLRHLFHEPADSVIGYYGTGRIVRVANENECRGLVDRREHGVEVVDQPAAHRDFALLNPKQLGDEFVDDEGMGTRHYRGTGNHKGMAQQLEDFIGTITDRDLVAIDTIVISEFVTQMPGAAVWIAVGLGQGGLHCSQSLRRGANGTFVGGQLDDILRSQTELAGNFFDRAPWFVRLQCCDCGIKFFEDG